MEYVNKYVFQLVRDAPRNASVIGDISVWHAPVLRAFLQASELVVADVFLRECNAWIESYIRHLPRVARFELIFCRSYGIPRGISRRARLERLHSLIVEDAYRLDNEFLGRVVIVWLEQHAVGCRRLMRKVGLPSSLYDSALGRNTTMLQRSSYQESASRA